MCFRIKLLQQFPTMISPKLSPDNLLSQSATSETCMMGWEGMFSEPNSFLNKAPLEAKGRLYGCVLPPGSTQG